jgi:hypothetical protein
LEPEREGSSTYRDDGGWRDRSGEERQGFRGRPEYLAWHRREDLDSGADRANGQVMASLHMATKTPYSVRYQAARFWLQTRCGWREPDKALLTSVKSFMDMTAEEFGACLIVNAE